MDITITGCDPERKVQAIKAIRSATGSSLEDAKSVIDQLFVRNIYGELRSSTGARPTIRVEGLLESEIRRLLDIGDILYVFPDSDAATEQDILKTSALLAIRLIRDHGVDDAKRILAEAIDMIGK